MLVSSHAQRCKNINRVFVLFQVNLDGVVDPQACRDFVVNQDSAEVSLDLKVSLERREQRVESERPVLPDSQVYPDSQDRQVQQGRAG